MMMDDIILWLNTCFQEQVRSYINTCIYWILVFLCVVNVQHRDNYVVVTVHWVLWFEQNNMSAMINQLPILYKNMDTGFNSIMAAILDLLLRDVEKILLACTLLDSVQNMMVMPNLKTTRGKSGFRHKWRPFWIYFQ